MVCAKISGCNQQLVRQWEPECLWTQSDPRKREDEASAMCWDHWLCVWCVQFWGSSGNSIALLDLHPLLLAAKHSISILFVVEEYCVSLGIGDGLYDGQIYTKKKPTLLEPTFSTTYKCPVYTMPVQFRGIHTSEGIAISLGVPKMLINKWLVGSCISQRVKRVPRAAIRKLLHSFQ